MTIINTTITDTNEPYNDKEWECIQKTPEQAVAFAKVMMEELSPEMELNLLTPSDDRMKQLFSFAGGTYMIRKDGGWLVRKKRNNIYFMGMRHKRK